MFLKSLISMLFGIQSLGIVNTMLVILKAELLEISVFEWPNVYFLVDSLLDRTV